MTYKERCAIYEKLVNFNKLFKEIENVTVYSNSDVYLLSCIANLLRENAVKIDRMIDGAIERRMKKNDKH